MEMYGKVEFGEGNPSVFARVICGLESRLFQLGLRMEYGSDFDKFERFAEATDKRVLSEHFQVALNTYTPENAFWLRAVTEEGETIALGAVRLDLLGAQTLDRHLAKYWKRCYPGELGNGATLATDQPRYLREVSGRVCYLGELWVARLWQGKKVHIHFSPLAMAIALQRWNPDWLYCWVRPKMWCKRYPLAYGFSAVHPVGVRWDEKPSTIDSDLVMALNRREWALDWMDALAAEFPLVSHS